MGEIPTQTLDHLRLSFEASDEDASISLDDGGYVLRLTDPAGAVVLSLTLSADIVDRVVLAKASCLISMAPDGKISARVDDPNAIAPITEAVELDRLIATSIKPEMLEDEPDAPTMLAWLRDRLRAALRDVEAAIDRF